MRDPDERIAWMLANKPAKRGLCANHVMRALGLEPQGFGSATEMARWMLQRGLINVGPPPRGALLWWTGGSDGFGHVAISSGPNMVVSTDVKKGASTGEVPFSWFGANWPAVVYRGWSWWFGGINTQPEEVAVAKYVMIKADTDQVIPLNKWVKLDLGAKDSIQPPIGSNDWESYVNLDFKTLKGASRNDLRYILGRWARHDATSNDLITMGGEKVDVTGADTKAIPPDLPERYWRSTWSHDFKGERGVPVSFWVYIGSMQNGTVTSPLRIFKIDDETT